MGENFKRRERGSREKEKRRVRVKQNVWLRKKGEVKINKLK